MLVVDTNVLIYAVNRDVPQHDDAWSWLTEAQNGPEPLGFAWLALVGFVRISTRSGILPSPLTVEQAMGEVEGWLASPAGTVVAPTARHPGVLAGLLMERGTGGNLTNDAHLAAIAIEHGATMVSFDRDFARFSGLRTLVPGAD